MSNINQDIAAVKAKISDLEHEIEAAEKKGRSENYILSLRSKLIELTRLLIELNKKENILLEKFNQIGAVGKLSDIPSYLN
jgi:predicted  nucleic acid-binding Zn-ribbon protein